MGDELTALINKALTWYDSLTLEEQAAHREAQRQSYVRAEMSWPAAKFKWVNGVKVYESHEDYLNG